jgi:hypothetical protein
MLEFVNSTVPLCEYCDFIMLLGVVSGEPD